MDNHKMATKTCECKSCGEKKSLDSFVRKVGEYIGIQGQKRYECIDCRVNSLYSDMVTEQPDNTPSPEEEKGIRRAFRWLNKKV